MSKFKVGDRVRRINRDGLGAPIGSVGVVNCVDHDDDDMTYQVLWDGGQIGWCHRDNAELAPPPRAPWRVLREAAELAEADGGFQNAEYLRSLANHLEASAAPKPPTLREAALAVAAIVDFKGMQMTALRAALAAEDAS